MSTMTAITLLVMVGIVPLVAGSNAMKQTALRGRGDSSTLQEHDAGNTIKRGLKDGSDCSAVGFHRKLTRGGGGHDDDCGQDGEGDDDGSSYGGSPVTDVDGLLHVGCFAHIMEDGYDAITTDSALTVNICYDICLLEKSLYMAVLQGNVCGCGNDPNFLTSELYLGTCDVTCGGNSSQRCGGEAACDLYELEHNDDGDYDGGDDDGGDDDGSTCSNGLPGVQDGNSCCVAECGTCGGTGCSTRVDGLGASDCCATEIEDYGASCEDTGMAPCYIGDGDDDAGDDGGDISGDDSGVDDTGDDDVYDSTCSNGFPGVQSGSSCCVAECVTCGGIGCSTRVDGLGASDCCATEIEDDGDLCEDVGVAPCFIDDDSTCSNGLSGVQSGSSCCVVECGTCGGTGCSTRVDGLGASDCCATEIADYGELCDDVGVAPCFIGDDGLLDGDDSGNDGDDDIDEVSDADGNGNDDSSDDCTCDGKRRHLTSRGDGTDDSSSDDCDCNGDSADSSDDGKSTKHSDSGDSSDDGKSSKDDSRD